MNCHTAKMDAARVCIAEHLGHVAPNGSACYATRAEAMEAARAIVSKSGKLDSAQIEEAFQDDRT